ncbi:LAGLIDADG family homing endonuclease [Micromonospora sp. LH3U1]|uniref:LAGLIDADG family homing endonuclease n=1 Tax=Micromonospora sp. LH3U1 TaxID=3018339 RepID=UPI00234B5B82|nr:LAGLIDADG family homing endonuclease [Micromonospora sp. LH3U1]WCN83168.1 LAGLIDADG family homing endonuclease [Micromonospora sp. LH3U1]
MAMSAANRVLTANRGWATLQGLRVGDQVFHPSGVAIDVTAVGQVQDDRDCYRVATTDGRAVIVDGDHLWEVTDKRAARSLGPRGATRKWFEKRVLSTRELVESGLSRYVGGGRTSVTDGKQYATNEYRYVLPDQRALVSDDGALPLDPYLLGAWLGDGNSSSASLTAHIADVPHWVAVIGAAGFMPTVRPGGGTPDTRRIGITCTGGKGRQGRSFMGRLTELRLRRNKHVPDAYLSAGSRQREALLQGLLDTDGTVNATRGQVEFCSMNAHLASAVLQLARSLGWRATLRTGRATLAGRDCGEKFRVFFTPVRTDPFAPFRLARKRDRVKALDGGKGRSTLSISAITVAEPVPVCDIQVTALDGLIVLGDDFVPTLASPPSSRSKGSSW